MNRKKLLIIVIISAAALILSGIAAVLLIIGNYEKSPNNPSGVDTQKYFEDGKLKYDDGAVVLGTDNPNQILEEIQEGYLSLSHKTQAVSSDGENFECYILNGIENKYDFFINIYKDKTAEEQLLLTGLIPPGSGIDHFKSEIKLEPGEYEALLVITQVEDDHETLRGNQLFLALHLIVE